MKTFEEAMKEHRVDPRDFDTTLGYVNAVRAKADQYDLKFKDISMEIMNSYLTSELVSALASDMATLMLAQLTKAFSNGVIVGIEMEKAE